MNGVLKWLLIALAVVVIAGLALVLLVVALFVTVSRSTEPAAIGPTISFDVVEPATSPPTGTLDAMSARSTAPAPETRAAPPAAEEISEVPGPKEGFQLQRFTDQRVAAISGKLEPAKQRSG